MDLKDEVVDTAKKVVEVFTVQYTKAYALSLVRICKEELSAPEEPDWKLTKRPGWTENYKTGYLTKEGGSHKSWKRRWFVVKPSYNVEYYESEAIAEKGPKHKKGMINLCGFWVNTNPNDSVLVRLKRLAERMGIDLSNIPKPKEYPPLTFELYHPRRRCWYITASTKEEFDDWVAQFRTCCWHARGFTLEDEAHIRAFPVAVRKTRWALGRWGWYSNYGTEEQVLAEIIADELDIDIMNRAYGKLTGPYFVRNMLRNKMVKMIDAAVLAVVKPAWAGMAKAVETLKPKIEPKIRGAVEPIFKAEAGIVEKLKDQVMKLITPIQEERVNPHLVKIVEIVRTPMTDAFAEAITLFDDKITKFEPGSGPLDKSFSDLDWFPRSYWQMRTATIKTEDMIEGLRELEGLFKDIWPWSLCCQGQADLREVTDNAVYTFEQALLKYAEDGKVDKDAIDKIKKDTLEKFREDADTATRVFSAKVMKLIILPPFEAVLQPAASGTVEGLANLVPEDLQEFIDINQDFEDLYNSILDDAIDNVVGYEKKDKKKKKKKKDKKHDSSSSSSSSDDEKKHDKHEKHENHENHEKHETHENHENHENHESHEHHENHEGDAT